MNIIEEYQATFGDTWARGLAPLPSHMQEGMAYYVLHGITPGSFLSAVLKNDLMGALRQADDLNRHALWSYGNFLHNYAPSDCFGSPERFDAWRAQGGVKS